MAMGDILKVLLWEIVLGFGHYLHAAMLQWDVLYRPIVDP